MRESEALSILEALLRGVDPTTGEVLEQDHLIRNTEVVSALESARAALDAPVKTRTKPLPSVRDPHAPKTGTAWSAEEDGELSDAINGMSTEEITAALDDIASRHRRKPSAIASRLAHLKLIENRFDVLAGAVASV